MDGGALIQGMVALSFSGWWRSHSGDGSATHILDTDGVVGDGQNGHAISCGMLLCAWTDMHLLLSELMLLEHSANLNMASNVSRAKFTPNLQEDQSCL